MSYINQAQDPRRKAAALVGVVAIHAAIGLGLVVGLTVTGIVEQQEGWDPFTLTPERKPPPPPPAPQPSPESQKSVITIPPTPLPPLGPQENAIVPEAVERSTLVVPTPGPTISPTSDPLQASLFTPRKPRPSNNPARWITNDDYPARPLRAEAEGVAGYRLIVATNGRVSACEVTRSTGNGLLDEATCDFIVRRARFEAATDETGAKVVGSYTGTVKWEIPE